jgi:hypothetical protein
MMRGAPFVTPAKAEVEKVATAETLIVVTKNARLIWICLASLRWRPTSALLALHR